MVRAALKSGSVLLHVKNNLPRKIINTFLILSLWDYSIGKKLCEALGQVSKNSWKSRAVGRAFSLNVLSAESEL